MLQSQSLPRRLVLGVLALVALAGVPAQAADTVQQRVYLGDLNLASSRGQQVMRLRVSRAIERVCNRPATTLMPAPRSRRDLRTCRDAAWLDVHGQLDQLGLTQRVTLGRR